MNQFGDAYKKLEALGEVAPVVAEPAKGVQPCDGDHPEPNCGAKDCWHGDPPQPAGSGEIELDLKAVNELSQLDKVTLAVRLFRAEAALRSKQGERNE